MSLVSLLTLFRMFHCIKPLTDNIGELFLGKSFEALKSSTPPTFVQDLDAYFMVQGLKGSFPWIFKIASYFPSKSWYRLQQAPDGLRTVRFRSARYTVVGH